MFVPFRTHYYLVHLSSYKEAATLVRTGVGAEIVASDVESQEERRSGSLEPRVTGYEADPGRFLAVAQQDGAE